MASIFTFDADPPRVSSPWSTPPAHTPKPEDQARAQVSHSSADWSADTATDAPISRLQAEQEDGPTEYKLHLLLRPRRSFTSSTTGQKPVKKRSHTPGPESMLSVSASPRSITPVSTTHSRQHRLTQLTTQLLWRLQQSSPFHSSASAPSLPVSALPEAEPKLRAPPVPGQLLPGLEESQGALYEIGVADDGALMGLAEDEMQESLNNLRAMAGSLGCTVEVLRMVSVGECEWIPTPASTVDLVKQKSKLWVAEAYIRPGNGTSPIQHASTEEDLILPLSIDDDETSRDGRPNTTAEQLRVSLTGPTMSGKSSLLGSLTTATFDNGRGKSRLSLLKHRHEIATGMTSSITQEVVGYHEVEGRNGLPDSARVVNYACGNISTWNDIHAYPQLSRLVFLSDSAGHPRYRRTTVRGLIGWAPHWTVLCMPADDSEDTSGRTGSTPFAQEVLGAAAAGVDLSSAHLELCLDLNSPLAIVITKFDLASSKGIKGPLQKIIERVRRHGRQVVILPTSASKSASRDDSNALLDIPAEELRSVSDVVRRLSTLDDEGEMKCTGVVPVLMTSSVSGAGMQKLHAVLHSLPLPSPPKPNPAQLEEDDDENTAAPPSPLFHIEDVFSKPEVIEPSSLTSSFSPSGSLPATYIVSGHLRYGAIHVGDELLLGPHAHEDESAEDIGLGSSEALNPIDTIGPGSIPPSISPLQANTTPTYSRALHARLPLPGFGGDSNRSKDFRRVRVVSARNLRLPVQTLYPDQVGTLALLPVLSNGGGAITTPAGLKIRKGMVLAGRRAGEVCARQAFVARFNDLRIREFSIGSAVVTYTASVRASAKVIAVGLPEENSPENNTNGRGHVQPEAADDSTVLLSLQFLASKEFVEVGAKVLVMPGGPALVAGSRGERGVGGLEGYIGSIVEGLG